MPGSAIPSQKVIGIPRGRARQLARRSFSDQEFGAGGSLQPAVAMATNNKHSQTRSVKSEFYDARDYSAMYDETVPVENAREIDSPSTSSDEEVVRANMAKFNPPVRHTARHDFDSESDSDSEPEKFINEVSGEDEVCLTVIFQFFI